jgi:hypothetical protein
VVLINSRIKIAYLAENKTTWVDNGVGFYIKGKLCQ